MFVCAALVCWLIRCLIDIKPTGWKWYFMPAFWYFSIILIDQCHNHEKYLWIPNFYAINISHMNNERCMSFVFSYVGLNQKQWMKLLFHVRALILIFFKKYQFQYLENWFWIKCFLPFVLNHVNVGWHVSCVLLFCWIYKKPMVEIVVSC